MESGSVPNFLPSTNAFRFTNTFPPASTVRIHLGIVGTVGVGNSSQGVCGGMVFAVRDYFEANLPPPPDDQPPGPDTQLFKYITDRLIDSFNAPAGVAQYADWMVLPSGDVNFVLGRRAGTFSRTVGTSWPRVQADIDSGHPSPLGLVTVHTPDLRQIGKCHQVLAYGYEVDDDEFVTINVYDPNTDHDSADDVWITFSAAHPSKVSPINHNIDIGEPTLHGFFRSSYSFKSPPEVPAMGDAGPN